ncbi:MAG TPA: hypothetical protein VFZ79_13305 [Acidimicrobiales bacterium]
MGQISDPYEQDEDELGITISGLPGEPDAPGEAGGAAGDAPAGPEGPADDPDGGETVAFDLDDWSEIERQAVTDRLREAGIPHAWDGSELQVAAVDEAPVDNILDIVEGGAGPHLESDREQVAYDLSDWDDDHLAVLAHELREAGIASGWDGDELFVHADDEAAVDDLLDRVAHPHELAPEPDDGPVGAELLGDLFVAADRLQRDGDDSAGAAAVLDLDERLDESRPPYGLDAGAWSHLCERVGALSALLRVDPADPVPDPDVVSESARGLRRALRPYV